jgi:hypothetical protein
MAVKVWLRRLRKPWAIISSIAKYVAAAIAVLVPLATVLVLYRTAQLQFRASADAVNQQKEAVNQQYVALAIGLLREKPRSDMEKALRYWEVDVFKKFAPIQISPAVEQNLREGGAIPLSGDVVSGTGSSGAIH